VNGRPIKQAALYGHDPQLMRLLEKAGANMEFATGPDELNKAAAAGDLARVEHLVDLGIDVNPSAVNRLTAPLIEAAYNGRTEVVRYLMTKGASLYVTDNEQVDAVMAAAYAGHPDLVDEMRSKGRMYKHTDRRGFDLEDALVISQLKLGPTIAAIDE